ncbi:MAG TPA: heavy metal translocating P-type ATPase [Ktedonobacterales bacterium]|nr:heavy metal translocating P-type ATPase [Ktedonobacterales bacterium]
MIEAPGKDNSTGSSPPTEETRAVDSKTQTPVTRVVTRLGSAARHYPLPLSVIALLVGSLIAWLVGWHDVAQWILIAVILLGGIPLLWATLRQLARGEVGVDVIAILAIGGSLILGQYLAGAIIVLMLAGGEALEAFALRRAGQSLAKLAERAPRIAHIWRDNELVDIPAEAVEREQVVVVKPGEVIPVDGLVVAGVSGVSEADLTGEPLPVNKEPGVQVLSGSVNLDHILEVRAMKRSAESQYARILQLVADAQQSRAPIHRLADRYGAVFTALAVSMAGIAWLLSGDSLYALAVLVVATPCPLILATPIAIMSGIDRAAHRGLIVKSGATIEQLGRVDVAVFDKTGTLTLGEPQLVDVIKVNGASSALHDYDDDTLLWLVASVEQFSTHILARAVVDAAHRLERPLQMATHLDELPGKGIQGRVAVATAGADGASTPTAYADVAVGNRKFMAHLGLPISSTLIEERERRTTNGQIGSFIAINGSVSALLVFADVPRPELGRLTSALKASGISETWLLTGDGEVVAQQIGKLAEIDHVVARCLPEQKVETIRALQARKHRVLMVGDGVNDAPALATASVGLAIGAQGLSAAAAIADAVLLSPDILQVAHAVKLGRRVMRVALQGIWIGMGLSLIAMVCAAFGLIPPTMGAILQEGIDVVVIVNALRATKA